MLLDADIVIPLGPLGEVDKLGEEVGVNELDVRMFGIVGTASPCRRCALVPLISSFPTPEVYLVWCPGHRDVAGNKAANLAATGAAEEGVRRREDQREVGVCSGRGDRVAKKADDGQGEGWWCPERCRSRSQACPAKGASTERGRGEELDLGSQGGGEEGKVARGVGERGENGGRDCGWRWSAQEFFSAQASAAGGHDVELAALLAGGRGRSQVEVLGLR